MRPAGAKSEKTVSCRWIESRVVLDLEELKFCCIPHSGNKGYVPICRYEGGPFPVEELRRARAKLIEANNTPGADSPCKGCHFLEKRDWAAERKSDALLEGVYVSNFSVCNLRCRYCYVYLFEKSGMAAVAYELLPVFEELIDNGHLTEDAYVEWGGGEPTILGDFAEITRRLLARGDRQQVFTSGVKYSDEIEQGLRRGLMSVVISIDSGTRETYLAVKGRDRFDVVWENVTRYARTGGDMAVKYILRANNSSARDVVEFARRAKEAGVARMVLTPDMREVARKTISEETIYAFALMGHEADRLGIPHKITNEYLNPREMKIASKYIPLTAENRQRYDRYRMRALGRETQGRHRVSWRRFRERDRTRVAVERAQQSLIESRPRVAHPFQLFASFHQNNRTVARLLERQMRFPNADLREALAAKVRAGDLLGAQCVHRRLTTLGFSTDSWTVDGSPGYLLVDASESPKPVAQDLWLACNASDDELPVTVTIADGVNDDVEYTFVEPQRVRVALPAVPAGEAGVFVVRTDRNWRSGCRDLGVQVAPWP